jgi:hypothetical protein
MTFKEEFLIAFDRGLNGEELLNLAQSRKLDAREAYKIVEQIWLELGFDSKEGEPRQENLEFVMEKLWYSSPARDAV